MEKGISYLNRNYSDYKQALIEYSKKYFPDFNVTYDDASVASWLIGINAAVADDLSYHIDRVYQETSIDSAQERASLFNIARNNGVKIPGPKGSMAEVRFSCLLPVGGTNSPDYANAPVIKRGTKVSSTTQIFELLEDVDFASQFNNDGVSDRTIIPRVNTNGIITAYTVTKNAVVVAGESRVYRQTLSAQDIKPFMEIVIPVTNVMNIESIIVVNGTNPISVPTYGTFYSEDEDACPSAPGQTIRFFEVENLAQSERWGDAVDANTKKALSFKYADTEGNTTYMVTKGEWKPVEHKFITEYTDNGYLKVIFGSGTGGNVQIGSSMSDFAKWQISRIMNNKALGLLPEANSTVFILYRVGGGAASNLAAGAINKFALLDAYFRGSNTDAINSIKSTISVVNTTPSVSGKDMPSNAELRYLIKYHNAAQNRCVTIKDYVDRILNLPPKYGTPFRVGVMEENNKIMVYLLGMDYNGKLETLLPVTLVKNIERYLERYRMINDYIEIKSGRIVNLSFDIDAIVDKNYNKTDIVKKIIEVVTNYMDVNSHIMGEEIYIGDLEKEVSKVDGLLNLIEIRVYNETGGEYSSTQIGQPTISNEEENTSDTRYRIDLDVTDGVIYNDGDTMCELKYPSQDIRIRLKER